MPGQLQRQVMAHANLILLHRKYLNWGRISCANIKTAYCAQPSLAAQPSSDVPLASSLGGSLAVQDSLDRACAEEAIYLMQSMMVHQFWSAPGGEEE